jgi:predicted phage tail protein
MALNSTSVIKIVDLLCEGPIAGIVGGSKGVFLDETPIQTGSSRNFPAEDVSHDFNIGGKTQNFLPQAGASASTVTNINTEIGENYSETLNADNEVTARDYGSGQLIRQITDSEADSFQLLFSIPRMFSTAAEGLAKGQPFNGSIRVTVSVQAAGTSYVKKYDRTITGVALNGYQFQTPKIDLTGTGPWNILVKKINLGEDHFEVKFANLQDVPQNTSLQNGRANQLIWQSLTEIQSVRTPYPYTAVAGLSISTRQFGSLPTRAYQLRGSIVKIPSNASVRNNGSLSFNGTFDGSLKTAWTTCPVCCWYDMLTHPRYGAGDFVQAANVSWVDLYPLARYANQLVTNPDGTKEARFACNTVIGSQAEAFNVLQDLASVFRGMLYWKANTIQATADHGNLDGSDVSPVHLYSNSNVIDGAFNYSGTSLKTRSTSIRVRYNDPENFYKSNFVVVEDAALISKYGYQVKEIVGFGVTSKFQAQRLGRWMLASEELDGEVVTFVTGLQGAVVLPGQVFAVSDEMRQGVRLAGRVSSATTTAITTDQTISLPSGSGHTLTCTLADGSIETRSISGTPSGAVINVSSAFSSAPLTQSIWSIASSSVELQKFRCLSVADNGDGQYAVTGVQHNDSIYATADAGAALEFDDITLFNETPTAPTNLTLEFRQITIGQTSTNRMIASWSRGLNGGTIGFEIRYKIGSGNFVTTETTGTTFEIDGLDPGRLITFQIRSVGVPPVNRKSAWVYAPGTVPAADIDPENLSSVVAPPIPADVTLQAIEDDQAILRWGIPPTGLNANNFLAIIRHAPQTDGTGTWPNSTLLRTVKAQTNFAMLPLIEGEYLVKFQDENGQRSLEAASAVIDLPNPIPRLNIQVRREDQDSPPYQGDKVGVFYDEDYDGLVLDGDATFDDVVDFDALGTFDFIGARLAAGRYYFNNVLDLGGAFSVLFTRKLTTRGLYPADTIDDRTELLDRWSDFDGDLPDDTSTDLYFRTSNQATTDEELLLENGEFFLLEDGTDKIQMESDIDFGAWVPMESGRYTGRQFQFKAELSAAHADQTPLVDELGYTMQLESRTESSATIASGTTAKVVTFANAFYQEPSLGINASNLASGDYYEVTSASRTGFTITFYDSSNTAVDRNFQYQAVGYGTEQT